MVWQVGDAARALLAVDDYLAFVRVRAQAAVGQVDLACAYDSRDGNPEQMAGRVAVAGVRVEEARRTRLAYAPEIAQAMLRAQQANSVVAARNQIVGRSDGGGGSGPDRPTGGRRRGRAGRGAEGGPGGDPAGGAAQRPRPPAGPQPGDAVPMAAVDPVPNDLPGWSRKAVLLRPAVSRPQDGADRLQPVHPRPTWQPDRRPPWRARRTVSLGTPAGFGRPYQARRWGEAGPCRYRPTACGRARRDAPPPGAA